MSPTTGRGFALARTVLALALVAVRTAVSPPDAGAWQRIINGVQTQQRPTTGALLINFDGLLGGICSGTLIGCRHFVTAAHCVCAGGDWASCGTPDPARFRVYLQHAGVLGVSAVTVNPSFSFGTAGDVAVLTLSTVLTGIRPALLNTTANPSAGMPGTIAGFGITGAVDDFGLLREGAVILSSCGTVAPEPAHVCWTFDDVIGVPGTDSNACSGDSGGSLFVDVGGRSVLAGVTSGGISPNCLPFDVSFASNVLQNRTFVESTGGADLSSAACGSTTQVGDGGTHVTAVSFSGPSENELACRKFVVRAYGAYTSAKLRFMRKCLDGVNGGSLTGPCPDATTVAKIAKVTNGVRFLATTIGSKCTPAVVGAIGAANACAGARDVGDLQRCVVVAASAVADDLLNVEYADTSPRGSMAGVGVRACQAAVARTMSTYGVTRMRLLARCQASADRGRIASCPDATTLAKIARRAGKVEATVGAACTDEQIAALNGSNTFGGSCATARSVATLARCEIAEHDAETDALFALLDGMAVRRQLTSASVSSGTARLRVTLNGIDAGANDLDLYVKRGIPPTTTLFDARSINGGVYEGIDLESPASGTWYVLVSPVGGGNVPYQLTITAFEP